MEIVTSGSGSGLLIAAEGADEHAVGALLRQHDPELRLVPRWDPEYECKAWNVYRYCGPDKPSEFVCSWQTREGQPLPLSSRLLDMVQTYDKNTSIRPPDPDELNAQRAAQIKRDHQTSMEALIDDWDPKHGRPVLPRSQSLRLARDKQRARGRKI